MKSIICPTTKPEDLPYGRYLLIAGKNVGGHVEAGISIGTKVLPNQFLEGGCSMFCLGKVEAAFVLPIRPVEHEWCSAPDQPEVNSWLVGYVERSADEVDRCCPWDVYFYDGSWWNEDGTEISEAPRFWRSIRLP